MSRGYFDYHNIVLRDKLFPRCYHNTPGQTKMARRDDPMEDKLLSELVYDIMEVLDDLDCYKTGDINEAEYRETTEAFRAKWFDITNEDLLRREIENNLTEVKENLYKSFGLN